MALTGSEQRGMDHERLLVEPGRSVRLDDFDPGYTGDFKDKRDAREKLAQDVGRLSELQDIFSAARTHAMLIVLQGLDTSGKDGAIKHVMTGINPQGVEVHSFREPSSDELAHDFLWRYARVTPERGRIGIFNRSYYEEVLVVRVHEDLLRNEQAVAPKREGIIWQDRFEDINAFERHLTRCGTVVVKFLLHVSKEEQRERLLARLEDPNKLWKLSANDVRERRYWKQYQIAQQEMLSATNTKWAPWHVIPADHKWFMRTAIADVIVRRLEALHLQYPAPAAQKSMLEEIRKELA